MSYPYAKDAGPPGRKRNERLYKILIIGELGVGKTSIIQRYVHQFFSTQYRATIGVDFSLKMLQWDRNTLIRLQLWDIAGQERFGSMTRVYYKEAVAAFIVFDSSRSQTFDAIMKWKNDIDEKIQLPNGESVPCVLLANKSDLVSEGLVAAPDRMSAWVAEHGFAAWFSTSAKDNTGIDEAATCIVNQILTLERSGNLLNNEVMDPGILDVSEDRSGGCASC